MENYEKKIIIFSLAGILLSGVGAPIAQAAPHNREDRQEQEQKQEQKRSNEHKKEQQRGEQQRSSSQRQEQQRGETQREEQQRQEKQRGEQQRLEAQRQEQQRSHSQRQEQQRAELQRSYAQRPNDREWHDQSNQHRDNGNRRHEYNNEQYRSSHWRGSPEYVEHKQPWQWYSRNHFGRRLITDDRWAREFPGLRSYSWRGSGFWYHGIEHRDLVMFYDDRDTLVSIGFWHGGRFVMIRDDNRSYYNHNPYVLNSRDTIISIQIRL